MLDQRYLTGVRYDDFDGLDGKVFAVPHHIRGWRYISTYADGKFCKDKIFSLLKKHGQEESPSEWDLHHIVEGNHLSEIDFDGRLMAEYNNGLPCVLIHRREEHELYSRLFRLSAAKALFRANLTGDKTQRSATAQDEAKTPEGKVLMIARLDKLANLYKHAYMGDTPLQKIAANVFRVLRGNIESHFVNASVST